MWWSYYRDICNFRFFRMSTSCKPTRRHHRNFKDAFRSKSRSPEREVFRDDTKVISQTVILRLKFSFRTFGTAPRKSEDLLGEARSFENQLGASNAADRKSCTSLFDAAVGRETLTAHSHTCWLCALSTWAAAESH